MHLQTLVKLLIYIFIKYSPRVLSGN